ncbi:MAG: bifunctional phosphoribosylaminoimidazolecarboxamide formyltransferase/IMP cyclohydrolase [Anaerolineae bacterium]
MEIKRALLSVYDKAHIVPFAKALSRWGIELIASGGTARALHGAGVTVRAVRELTGTPEILGGRVKTLHPAIHGGLLSRRTPADRLELDRHGWSEIDLVAIDLYPFEAVASDPHADPEAVIEQIDIGGVALLRAAAKNCAHVVVVCDPADYAVVLGEMEKEGDVLLETRRQLAAKAFARAAAYDDAVWHWSIERCAYAHAPARREQLPHQLTLRLDKWTDLRYGENPHQQAALYTSPGVQGPLGSKLLQGKPLSYNNILDLDAAWRACTAFVRPAVVIVKHLSPCGIACADTLAKAFPLALAGDPVAAFGSVIALNELCDGATARALDDLFVEAIAAPGFASEARDVLGMREDCRLLTLGDVVDDNLEIRGVRGGVLVQERDPGDQADWQVVTKRAPSKDEMRALRFAWQAAAHVKSNAILLAQGQAAVGIGGGLPSRVDAVRLAVAKAGERARGAVMASDAFFPFPDGVEVAAEAGVTAVVQPGGSLRDEQVIAAADELGLAMCVTGVRHFRH